jgi:hypothetical protein
MRAWIALAFGDEGNPYSDEPGIAYGFDDHVQNHKQVRPGDLLFLRNRDRLEGIGRIARIEEGLGDKTVRRCPICENAQIHQRRRATLSFRCAEGHEFDRPAESRLPVKTFRAHFDGDFLSIMRRISPDELKPFQLRNSTQLAIMPADLDGLSQHVTRRAPDAGKRLLEWTNSSRHFVQDYDADDAPDLTPEGLDHRARMVKGILLRRGQRGFRDKLIDRYGEQCVISGCRVLGVLEAAHIRPYRGPGDNHPANGLLLRSDLHTLFDLDRIGIHPDTLNIVLHKELEDSEYAPIKGKTLLVNGRRRPDREALLTRWNSFTRQYATNKPP